MPRDHLPIGPIRCLCLRIRCWLRRHPRWTRWLWVAVLALIALLTLSVKAALGAEEKSLRPLLDVARHVESAGDDHAVGDNGRSRGPLQSGRAAWKEGCEFLGVTWDYDKCVWLRFESEAVFIAYTHRWGARTHEERARCWNSGPKWRKKYHLTNKYWARVQKALRSAARNRISK